VYALAPIAWPTAKLLDAILGKNDVHTYKKAELKSFLQFHRTGEEPLRDDEISILNGVLELNTKKVESIMTPMKVGPEFTCVRAMAAAKGPPGGVSRTFSPLVLTPSWIRR
jgi:hypothetical protein